MPLSYAAQAYYDAALEVSLNNDDVVEAKRILDALKDAQRNFKGCFEKWHGGSFAGELWVDNPQYKLTIGDRPLSVSVSVDKDGNAEYVESAVHVVKCEKGALQCGELKDECASSAYDNDTCSLKFQGDADSTYFIVPSTQEPNLTGGFSITTIGVGNYTLEPVDLIQVELRAAMKDKKFEMLPALVERAEAEEVNIPNNPIVAQAKLIGDIEKGWQARDAEMMGTALTAARKAKVDKLVIKAYMQRYKQLAIEVKLKEGLGGNTGLLLAATEEAKLISYDGAMMKDALTACKKFKCWKTIASTFLDDQAAGARKFGAWRENPTWKLTASKKETVYVAVNEDGQLDAATQAKLDDKKAKAEAKYMKARDKMASTQAAFEADEKNDELGAAAKDAARVFNELDEARKKKQVRSYPYPPLPLP